MVLKGIFIMAMREQAPNPQQPENTPLHEVQMVHLIPEETIMALLKTLPIPVNIERKTFEKPRRGRTHYYTYQAGLTSAENPVGIRMGIAPHFLEAVQFGLAAVLESREVPGRRLQ